MIIDKVVREQLIDFLQKILVFDPSQRLTPDDALKHPFITSAVINNTASSSSPDVIFTNTLPNSMKKSGSLNTPSKESSIRVREESGISSISTTSTTLADSNRTLDTPATEVQEEIAPGQVISPKKQPKSILKSKPSTRELSGSKVQFDENRDTTYLIDDASSNYSTDRPHSAMLPTNNYKIANYFYQQPRPKTVTPTLVHHELQKMLPFNEYHSQTVYMAPQYYHYPLIPPN